MTTIRMSSLLDQNVLASDGAVGTIYDLYFSDRNWTVEHFILQSGPYFNIRRLIVEPKLILSASSFDDRGASATIQVAKTRKEILSSPDYLADPPVSEQRSHDPALHPGFLWFPTGDTTKVVLRPLGAGEAALQGDEANSIALGLNPRLQSFREVRGYAVHTASDEEEREKLDKACIGHVLDLRLDSDSMTVDQVIVDTGHGPTRDALVVRPIDVRSIEWADVHMYLNCTRAELGMPLPL